MDPFREYLGIGGRRRFADDSANGRQVDLEMVSEPLLDDDDRGFRDIDSDPTPFLPMCSSDRRSAPTERIQHDVAFARASANDSLEERLRLLSGIPEPLLCPASSRAKCRSTRLEDRRRASLLAYCFSLGIPDEK
jgi:hypothetical protein